MFLELTPNDTFFFRDAKPFTMGDQSEAGGIFPPNPTTLYGAIRSAYVAHNGGLMAFTNGEADLKKVAGTYSEKGIFKIRGIFINEITNQSNGNKSEKKILFPLPNDIIVKEEDKYQRLSLVKPGFSTKEIKIKGNSGELSLSLPYICQDTEDSTTHSKVKSAGVYFIGGNDLNQYLLGKLNMQSLTTVSKSQFLDYEPKIGIARDFVTRGNKEGMLYRVDMMRLKSGYSPGKSRYSLIIEVEDINFCPKGVLKLGGEGKSFGFEFNTGSIFKDKIISIENLKKEIVNTKNILLYIATPSLFSKGWLPGKCEIQDKSIIWETSNFKLKLLTASIGKAIPVGGWDLEKREPKPLRKAVPGGSVYFFELEKGNICDVIDYFHTKNISDYLKEEGYGLSLVGTFNIS